MDDVRLRFKRVAIGHEQRSCLADFDGAEAILDSENSCWNDGDGFQRGLAAHPVHCCKSSIERQVADVFHLLRPDRHGDACIVHPPRVAVGRVVAVVIAAGVGEDGARDHGDACGGDLVGHPPALRYTRQHGVDFLLLDPLQRLFDVLRRIDLDEQRGFAANDGRECCHLGLVQAAAAVGVDPLEKHGLLPRLVEILQRLVELLLDVLVRAVIRSAGPRRGREVEDDALEAGIHLIRCVAVQIDQRRRPRHDATGRRCEDRRHARNARNRDADRTRVHRRQRLHLRPDVADLVVIDRLRQ